MTRRLLPALLLVLAAIVLFAEDAHAQAFRPLQPSFSRDAKRIVFVADGGGKSRQVCVVNTDGTGLACLAGADNAMNPRFSTNGKRIVFARWDAKRTNTDIWVISTDGSGLKQVTNTAASNEAEPDFGDSPEEMVFIRRDVVKDSPGAAILYSLTVGKEFELLPKTLNVQRVFIADNGFFITCACSIDPKKPQLVPDVAANVYQVFMMSFERVARRVKVAESKAFANLDSVRAFRSSGSGNKYAYDILFQPISGQGMAPALGDARSGFFIHEGASSVQLSTWLISSFDLSADGSRLLISGYPEGKGPQRLWIYDLKTTDRFEVKIAP